MVQQDYSDIIGLEHHQSERHPHMSNYDRAAQFSPFAALTGYEDCITEAARFTDGRIELDEETKERLDEKLRILQTVMMQQPEVTFTFFQRDEHKEGGAYVTLTGAVKKIDPVRRQILLADGTALFLDDIVSMEGPVFSAAIPEKDL